MNRISTIILFTIALTSTVLIFQNCTGTRTLSADLNVSNQQVNAQVRALESDTLASFFEIYNAQGSSIFYSEAPSTMGSVSTVMPLDLGSLGVSGNPSHLRAYFVIAGSRAGLLITQVGGDSGSETESVLASVVSNQDGSLGDFEYSFPASSSAGDSLTLHTFDVSNGDLSDTIQLDIQALDPNGEWGSYGFLTLTQPD